MSRGHYSSSFQQLYHEKYFRPPLHQHAMGRLDLGRFVADTDVVLSFMDCRFVCIETQRDPPQLLTSKPVYQVGETIEANCTTSPSRPIAHITWLVNGKPVSRVHSSFHVHTGAFRYLCAVSCCRHFDRALPLWWAVMAGSCFCCVCAPSYRVRPSSPNN
jgi:hypothetical protein